MTGGRDWIMERENFIRWSEIEPLCVLKLLARKLWLLVLVP